MEPGVAPVAESHRPSPERELLDREARRLREEAMKVLTPMERTAFVLRHMEDQPIPVISAALGVPENSARQAVFRAIGKLRRQLKGKSSGSFAAGALVQAQESR